MGERIHVIQAYEAPRTPPWIATCMESVRKWCVVKGFDYHVSREFFALVPPKFIERCGPDRGPATDYARAVLLERRLSRCDIAIWVDADVLVFNPDALDLPDDPGFFGIAELTLLYSQSRKEVALKRGINGAILGAGRRDQRLQRYRQAIDTLLTPANTEMLQRTAAGPDLLTMLSASMPMGQIENVGLLTYFLIEEIARERPQLCKILMQELRRPLAAANLCHFIAQTLDAAQLPIFEATIGAAMERLISSRGDAINRFAGQPL